MAVYLKRLRVTGVRNLHSQVLDFGPGLNFLYGANGSGKTSVLEAISLLAMGRSFRTATVKPLIQHSLDACLAQGTVHRSTQQHALGIQRFRNGAAHVRVDGVTVQSLTRLAELLPVVLLNTDSVELVTGAPELRRRFLDGLVFHVEQTFLHSWRVYYRALRQRNAGLRRGTLTGDAAWRREMAQAGEALTTLRSEWASILAVEAQKMAACLSPDLTELNITFRAGWSDERSLAETLDRRVDGDSAQGFSQVGPHRADLKITVGGRSAADTLSRGQLKLVVTALKLAQGRMLSTSPEVAPVYLVDDIAAELDRNHSAAVCGVLAEREAQIILTSASRSEIEQLWPTSDITLFHVEQGSIRVAT